MAFYFFDPLYILINILSHKIGAGVEIVNLISTIILFLDFILMLKGMIILLLVLWSHFCFFLLYYQWVFQDNL